MFDADHWVTNLRNPVRFARAVATAATDKAIFVEVSPHPLLAYAIKDTVTGPHRSLPTLQRDANDTVTFHTHQPQRHPHGATAEDPAARRFSGAVAFDAVTHAHHWFAPTSPKQVQHPASPPSEGERHAWFPIQLSWPVRELPQGDSDVSWLVFGDGGLAELLGTGSATLPLSVLDDADAR